MEELKMEDTDENHLQATKYALENNIDIGFSLNGIKNEFTLQNECVKWVRSVYPELLFTATCGGLGSQRMNKKMNKQGYLHGVPDIVFLNGFAIEMKWKRGGLRECQKEVIERMRSMGWTVYILRTPEDFIHTVERFILPHWYILHKNDDFKPRVETEYRTMSSDEDGN